jgi:hypothetical protein
VDILDAREDFPIERSGPFRGDTVRCRPKERLHVSRFERMQPLTNPATDTLFLAGCGVHVVREAGRIRFCTVRPIVGSGADEDCVYPEIRVLFGENRGQIGHPLTDYKQNRRAGFTDKRRCGSSRFP